MGRPNWEDPGPVSLPTTSPLPLLPFLLGSFHLTSLDSEAITCASSYPFQFS